MSFSSLLVPFCNEGLHGIQLTAETMNLALPNGSTCHELSHPNIHSIIQLKFPEVLCNSWSCPFCVPSKIAVPCCPLFAWSILRECSQSWDRRWINRSNAPWQDPIHQARMLHRKPSMLHPFLACSPACPLYPGLPAYISCFDKISIQATEERQVLFGFTIWGYSPWWQWSHGDRYVRQLVTLYPQSGSREKNTDAQLCFFICCSGPLLWDGLKCIQGDTFLFLS